MKRLAHLDGLRGIAAIIVVLYHFPNDARPSLFVNYLCNHGHHLVDVFFVLSGFILMYKYREADITPRGFLSRRFWRIVPLLICTNLLFILKLLIPVVIGKAAFDDFLIRFLESFFLSDSHLLFGGSIGLNPASWSVTAELYAYLIFSLIYFRERKYRIILSAIIVLSSFVTLFNSNGFLSATQYGLNRCLYGFFIGCLVSEIKFNFAIPYSGILLLIFVSLGYFFDNDWFFRISPIIYSILVLSIANGNAPMLLNGIIQYLGKISFSLYLIHPLFLSLYHTNIVGAFYIYLLVSILGADILYKNIESKDFKAKWTNQQ